MLPIPCPVGLRFGIVTVTGEAPSVVLSGKTRRQWTLRCDCGVSLVRTVSQANSGRTTACPACAVLKRVKHGESPSRKQQLSREYSIWQGMRRRCESPTEKSYTRYGGRGIRICERWRDFRNFLADMGRRPSPVHQIERIDNNGNYDPRNCAWVTPKENARNKRSNRMLTHGGRTQCLAAWADDLGGSPAAIGGRLSAGHRLEVALGAPIRSAQVLDASRDKRKRTPLRDAVLATMSGAVEPPAAIAARLGKGRHSIRTALTRLEREGKVERLGWGKWRRCG